MTGAVSAGLPPILLRPSLKYRDYYYNWNSGHRYVLNLREDESYTRYYQSARHDVGLLGEQREDRAAGSGRQTFEIDSTNRFGMRGNGKLDVHAEADGERVGARGVSVEQHRRRRRRTPAGLSRHNRPRWFTRFRPRTSITSQKIEAQFARCDPLRDGSAGGQRESRDDLDRRRDDRRDDRCAVPVNVDPRTPR